MKTFKFSVLLRSFFIFVVIMSLISCNDTTENIIINNITDTSTADTPTAWAVGNQNSSGYGSVLFSDDSGISWAPKGEDSIALKGIDIMNLFVVDKNIVWIVGTNNTIARTTDAGETWCKIYSIPEVDAYFYDISIVDKTNIWVSGDNGVVYNSTDNGNSWIVHDTSAFHEGLVQGIVAININVIYAVGQHKDEIRGFITRTIDGGVNWNPVVLEDDYNSHEWIRVVATDENHVIVYGGKGYYSYTENGGEKWINSLLDSGAGVDGADINDMIMINDLTWWGALDLENIYLTKDQGSTWISQKSAGRGNMFLIGIDAYDINNALIVGRTAGWPLEGKIIHTSDGGTTWNAVKETDYLMQKISFTPKEN